MRYTQPQSGPLQLDSSNPITRGLAFVFVSLNGQAVGWRAGKTTAINAVSNAVRTLTPQGKALAAATAGDMIYDTGLTGITTSNYGLFVAATANTSGVQSAIDDDSGSGFTRVLQFRLNSFLTELITFDTAGTPYFATAAAALSAAQINAGFTMGAQVAGNAIAVFQNGVKTTGSAANTPKTSLGDLRVGNYKGGASSGWSTGGIALTVGWSRTPTDAEFRSMAVNPWQLFKNQQRHLLVDTTGAGPVNATGTFASTLGNATLAASGIVLNAGAFASTLGNATMASSGSVGTAPSGTMASALADATMSAAGAATNAGSFATSLAGASMSSAGIIINRGTFSATMGDATMAAAGTVAPNVTGIFSSTLDGATMAAYGYNGVPPVLAGFFHRLPKNPRHVQRIP